MKNLASALVLALSLFFLSGCAIHNRVSWQDQLTLTVINNTNIDLEVLVNGRVSKDLPSAQTTALGFYTFVGRREVIPSVRGLCPESGVVYRLDDPREVTACVPGSIVGNNYRGRLWVRGDGTYRRAEVWFVRGVRPLSGGLL